MLVFIIIKTITFTFCKKKILNIYIPRYGVVLDRQNIRDNA